MSKRKHDSHLTGMAGEFLTVGKLFKRGYQTSITIGNAKAIDVFVYNPQINKSINVQVKTLRHKNCFQLRKEDVKADYIYIFIILHDFEHNEDFFILTGKAILSNVNKFFGSSYKNPDAPSSRPAINYGPLKEYKDKWDIFDS